METLSEAITRLSLRGYATSFRPLEEPDHPVALVTPSGDRFAPGALAIDEIVRFEGSSDPADEAALFALRDPDSGLRGTLVVAYGPGTPPAEAAVLHALGRSAR